MPSQHLLAEVLLDFQLLLDRFEGATTARTTRRTTATTAIRSRIRDSCWLGLARFWQVWRYYSRSSQPNFPQALEKPPTVCTLRGFFIKKVSAMGEKKQSQKWGRQQAQPPAMEPEPLGGAFGSGLFVLFFYLFFCLLAKPPGMDSRIAEVLGLRPERPSVDRPILAWLGGYTLSVSFPNTTNKQSIFTVHTTKPNTLRTTKPDIYFTHH